MNIEDLESRIETGLAKLRSPEYKLLPEEMIPSGYRARVILKNPGGHKKRYSASVDSWSPQEGDYIEIRFEPESSAPPIETRETERRKQHSELMSSATGQTTIPAQSGLTKKDRGSSTRLRPDPVHDLIQALDKAESRPDFQFVALKWFRDTFLIESGFSWTSSETERQKVLREAIERRLILTGKMPNPRFPEFPVTSIRLNRLLPEVQSILGGTGQADDFEPVSISGDPLSMTVLSDRR